MVGTELENKIRDLIRNLYNAEYTGLIKVDKLIKGYKILIGIPSYMAPTSLATDCETEEEFLNFVTGELKSRNYIRQDYYEVHRQDNVREE